MAQRIGTKTKSHLKATTTRDNRINLHVEGYPVREQAVGRH